MRAGAPVSSKASSSAAPGTRRRTTRPGVRDRPREGLGRGGEAAYAGSLVWIFFAHVLFGKPASTVPGHALTALAQHHQVVWIGITEQGARLLIEHIRVEPIGFEEPDAAVPALVFGFGLIQIRGQRRRLLLEDLAGIEPVIARIRIGAEIADQRRSDCIKNERAEERANARASDHGSTMRRPRKRGVKSSRCGVCLQGRTAG